MTKKQPKKKGFNFHELVRQAVAKQLELLQRYLDEAVDDRTANSNGWTPDMLEISNRQIIQLTTAIASINAQVVIAAAQAHAAATGALMQGMSTRVVGAPTVNQTEANAALDLAKIREELRNKAGGRLV